MRSAAAKFLALAALAVLASAQSINVRNTPNASTNQTIDLQEKRDWWCHATNVYDRNYNASQQFFYRVTRRNVLGDYAADVVDYQQGGSTTRFIQTMRWPFGLLLTILCIVFIVWIVFLVYACGACRKTARNEGVLTGCLRLAWLVLLLFIGLFVIIMIFMAYSEISQRRSKCQVLNAGNMLVNGYVSQMNGNAYVGLNALNQAVFNFRSEHANVGRVGEAAVRIANQNFPSATANAINRLQAVAADARGSMTTSPLGFMDTPQSVKEINGWWSDAAKQEFSDLHTTAITADAAAKTLIAIQNGLNGNQNDALVTATVNTNAFFRNLTDDVTSMSLGAYRQVRDRYTYASGGYWTIFALSIVIIALAIFLLVRLHNAQNRAHPASDFRLSKVLLAILGFLLVWYAIVTIILLAGSASIATYCQILGAVNSGNWNYVDQLNIRFPGNSRQVLRECTVGKTGDLWNFGSQWPGLAGAAYSDSVRSVLAGIGNYLMMYQNPQISGSSAIATHISQYQAIRSGIAFDYPNVLDQFDTLYRSWSNSTLNSNKNIPSLTTFNCTALQAADRTRCNPLDNTQLFAYGTDATYSNYTIANNLAGYIQSEQALLNSFIQNLRERNDVLTPGQAFRNVKSAFDQRIDDVRAIYANFPGTFAPFSQYFSNPIYAMDCRNVRRELLVLEDYYCFELNYWVNILVVIAAISLILFFVLTWALCAAIREADTEEVIAMYPTPVAVAVVEDKASINERELIPQA